MVVYGVKWKSSCKYPLIRRWARIASPISRENLGTAIDLTRKVPTPFPYHASSNFCAELTRIKTIRSTT